MGVCEAVKSTAICDELAGYRANLVRLRHELAIMQSAALSCRAAAGNAAKAFAGG